MDGNCTYQEEKELFSLLVKSTIIRDNAVEFAHFDSLSHNVSTIIGQELLNRLNNTNYDFQDEDEDENYDYDEEDDDLEANLNKEKNKDKRYYRSYFKAFLLIIIIT